ncbi:MAG TPA: alpha/beta fold hydrolase [Myxococcales bacterium]|nr:alpha/beta fold hydrolase [Myxococcales bacterium]
MRVPEEAIVRGSWVSAGTTLDYQIEGEGPPLLMLMGLGCPGEGWRPQIDALKGRFRTIAPDQRGSGRTAHWRRPIRVPELARDALRLLDHLRLERAHLIGVSMGGMVALEVAGRWPERVDRLVLGAAPLAADRHVRLTTLGIGRQAALAFPRGGLRGSRDAVEAAWRPLVFNGQLAGEGKRFVDEQMAAFDDPRASYGVTAQAAAVFFHDASRWAKRIRAPTLLVAGSEDRMIPAAAVCRAAEAVRGSRLVFLEGAPHGFNVTHAAAFNRLIADFLTGPTGRLAG